MIPKISIKSFSPSPELKSHVSRFSIALRRTFSRRRPWLELIESTALSRPSSLSEATTRIRKNLSYFRINYLAVLAVVITLSLLYHPLSLLTLLSLVAAWLFYLLRPADQQISIFNRNFADREAMWILIVITVLVVFLTSIGSLLMSAIGIGIGIICLHGAFRDPDDLFIDDQDLAGSGLFSFVGGSAVSSVAAAAAPAIASQV